MAYPNPANLYQPLSSSSNYYTVNPYGAGSVSTSPASGHLETPNKHSDVGSQASTSPRPRRITKKVKAGKTKGAPLSHPLSRLCPEVPVVDVSERVNRSMEERQQEAQKVGKIKRPSNSFMLYRSAYGDRVKAMYPQNNHQIISTICGASWKMETPEILEKYKAFYEMEKNSHAKAHPEYKFSPAKSSPPNRKRKANDEDLEEELNNLSDLGDNDLEYTPSGSRKPRPAKMPRMAEPANYSPYRNLESYYPSQLDGSFGYTRSLYQATNPGKPLPAPMNIQDTWDRYYQLKVVPRTPHVEDVFFQKMQAPRIQQGLDRALIGLPGAQHNELLEIESAEDNSSPQVDPVLLDMNAGFQEMPTSHADRYGFEDLGASAMYDNSIHAHSHPHDLHYQSFDPWQLEVDPSQADGFTSGADFEALLDQSHNK